MTDRSISFVKKIMLRTLATKLDATSKVVSQVRTLATKSDATSKKSSLKWQH